jgi:hypothetical protein
MSETCNNCGKMRCVHTEHYAQQCEEYALPQKGYPKNLNACVRGPGFLAQALQTSRPLRRDRVSRPTLVTAS